MKCLEFPELTAKGSVILTKKSPPFDIGETINYSCLGSDIPNVATCRLVNGKPSWDYLKCQTLSCGAIPHIDNAIIEGSDYSVFKKVTISCNPGFQLMWGNRKETEVTTYCSISSMWHPAINKVRCEPILCPAPDNPLNGTVRSYERTYDSEAIYECNKGFKLVGNSKRFCGADGKWDVEAPTCEQVTCPHPGILPNGTIMYKGDKLSFLENEILVYKPFNSETPQIVKCKGNGKWSLDEFNKIPDESSDENFDERPDENFDERPDESFDERPDESFDERPDENFDERPHLIPDKRPHVIPEPDKRPHVIPEPDKRPHVIPHLNKVEKHTSVLFNLITLFSILVLASCVIWIMNHKKVNARNAKS